VLVIVDRGATVQVDVPQIERRDVSLLYATAQPPGPDYRVRDGDSRVVFHACPDRATQFNGGFVVAGPRCVGIDVRTDGGRRSRESIPFGVGSCRRS
jgi:hypothetical protein